MKKSRGHAALLVLGARDGDSIRDGRVYSPQSHRDTEGGRRPLERGAFSIPPSAFLRPPQCSLWLCGEHPADRSPASGTGLARSVRRLGAAGHCVAPAHEGGAEPRRDMSSWLAETAKEVFALHHDLLDGIETGALVPERPRTAARASFSPPGPSPFARSCASGSRASAIASLPFTSGAGGSPARPP